MVAEINLLPESENNTYLKNNYVLQFLIVFFSSLFLLSAVHFYLKFIESQLRKNIENIEIAAEEQKSSEIALNRRYQQNSDLPLSQKENKKFRSLLFSLGDAQLKGICFSELRKSKLGITLIGRVRSVNSLKIFMGRSLKKPDERAVKIKRIEKQGNRQYLFHLYIPSDQKSLE